MARTVTARVLFHFDRSGEILIQNLSFKIQNNIEMSPLRCAPVDMEQSTDGASVLLHFDHSGEISIQNLKFRIQNNRIIFAAV
jgi:hypothetical protein